MVAQMPPPFSSHGLDPRSRLAAKVAVCLIAEALFSSSCARKDSGVLIETVDGVRVVHNLARKPEKAFRKMGVIEDLIIGGDERNVESLFFAPVDIDSDTEGAIYVLDSRDALIRHFDRNGAFRGTIGRKGQGPGEFEGPGCMEVLPDGTILVVDPALMRLTTLASNGNFVRSVILRAYVVDIDSGKDGTVIAGYHDPDNSEICAGVLDAATGEMARLFGQRTYWPARTMNDAMTYDFPYFIRFALGSKNRLYVGSAVTYELSVMDLRGQLEFRFKKDQDRIPVQGEMLKRISEMSLRGPNPYVRDPYLPFFESLTIDERGRIWVRHYLPKLSAHTNSETPYDVFSPDGIFLFETRIPGHIYSKLVFRNGCAYALKKADSGDLLAVRLKIED